MFNRKENIFTITGLIIIMLSMFIPSFTFEWIGYFYDESFSTVLIKQHEGIIVIVIILLILLFWYKKNNMMFYVASVVVTVYIAHIYRKESSYEDFISIGVGGYILMIGVIVFVIGVLLCVQNGGLRVNPKIEKITQEVKVEEITTEEATTEKIKPEGALYSLYGVNGQLYVFENRIEIERKGVLGLLSQGMAGTKTIPMNNVLSVQFQEGNELVNGFIQFGVLGSVESKGGIFKATGDENTVMVSAKNNHIAKEIKEYVENIILNRENSSGTMVVQQQLSGADEIKKYKELMDSGVISQEEFDAKKKQILGI